MRRSLGHALVQIMLLATLVNCSSKETFHDIRSHKEAALTQRLTLPPPEGLPKPASPFAKNKLMLTDKKSEPGDGSVRHLIVIYREVQPCTRLVRGVPGFVEASEIFDGEFSASIDATAGFDFGALAQNDCVVGIADNPDLAIPASERVAAKTSLSLTDLAPLEAVGYDNAAQVIFNASDSRVKVAVVDSGIDLNNAGLKAAITPDLRTTTNFFDPILKANVVGDIPSDELGHGTAVASIIADKDFGLARDKVEIIPIKVTSTTSFGMNNLVVGIRQAVNKGAQVIAISAGGDTLGCNPAVGYVVLKALEKGVFFVVPAGNGIKDIGYPVVAARDDGPASYETTFTPACWSHYFLGVVAVAALDAGNTTLAPFSNFGDDLELAAPGVGIKASQLNNAVGSSTGTSFSVPFVASAAALAIAHHTSKGLTFAPWYIENLLVESANKDPLLTEQNRRVRAGSIVNFGNLASLLKKTESMTDSQRRNDIKTISPREGDGWHPGTDVAELKMLQVSFLKNSILPGESVPYTVTAFYRTKPTADVTSSPDTLLTLSNPDLMSIEKPGVIRVKGVSAFPDAYKKLTITANYSEKQAQVYNTASFAVVKEPVVTKSLRIQLPATPVRIGQSINFFHAFLSAANLPAEIDVTGSVTWTTSATDELSFTPSTGVLDATWAISAKTYTISAEKDGVTAAVDLTVADESVSSFQIHSYLGAAAIIEAGQQLVTEPHFILSGTREVALPAVWSLADKVLNNGAQKTSLTIDTTGMPAGAYTLKAVSTFRHIKCDKVYEGSYDFKVGDAVDRIEIQLKDTIVTIGQDFQIDLRSYRLNNSYSVVTEDAVWTSDSPDLVSINKAGIGHIDAKFAGTLINLSVQYLGRTQTIELHPVAVSAVTGSSSNIDHIELTVTPNGYCSLPSGKVIAVYKDKSVRDQVTETISYSHLNANGQWENATTPLYGGHTYRLSATYNDGNSSAGGNGNAVISQQITLPVVPLDHLTFVSDPGVVSNSVPVVANMKAASSNGVEVKDKVCALRSARSSSPDLAVEAKGGFVKLMPVKTGDYLVDADAIYTGEGTDKLIAGSFAVHIDATKPTSLRFYSTSLQLNKLAYGSLRTGVILYDDGKTEMSYKQSDMVFHLYENGVEIDPNGARIYQTGFGSWLFYPREASANYRLTVVHTPTQLAGELSFTMAASWEDTEAAVIQTLPSTSPPSINQSIDPACLAQVVTSSMPGSGATAADPYVICNEADFAKMSVGNRNRGLDYYRLGRNFDFGGRIIQPIEVGDRMVYLDGAGRSLANFTMVDAERDGMGFFAHGPYWAENLTVLDPTVRGRYGVGALSGTQLGGGAKLYVVGGTVMGAGSVGGLAGLAKIMTGNASFVDVGVFDTEVRYDQRNAGGIFGVFNGASPALSSQGAKAPTSISQGWVFTGRVQSSGVPGQTQYIGGLVGIMTRAVVRNSLVTGTVQTLNDGLLETMVGGLVGSIDGNSEVSDSEFSGLVVSTGASVGGIVGAVESGSAFGVNPMDVFKMSNLDQPLNTLALGRTGGILLRNKVSGSVWGGMSKKELLCAAAEELVSVLGTGGSTSCTGDIVSQNGGFSNAGGIAGSANSALLQENIFAGKVRGVNLVGGISGTTQLSNYVRNDVSGLVSASNGVKDYGSLVGAVKLDDSFPASKKIPSRFAGNTVKAGSGMPAWEIGNNLGELQQATSTNVPQEYPAN